MHRQRRGRILRGRDSSSGQTGGFLVLGDGDRGVLLVPQSDGDICQWLPTGRRLAADGYLVGLMDWTSPFDTAVTTAAALLREAGATELVLVGASRGGAYVLGVAGTLRPAPAGVVSFSGEGRLGEWDADARIRSYRGPLLRLGSEVTCTASCSPARTRIRSRPRLTSS
jgi:hypothetical protein